MKKYKIFFFVFGFLSLNVGAQQLEDRTIVSLKDYIEMVIEKSHTYQGVRLNSKMAKEEIGISKKRPDPELEILYRENTEDHLRQGPGVEGEISWDLEFGGKRKTRVQYANTSYELAEMEQLDFEQSLKLEASLIYLEAIKEQQLYQVQKASYESIRQIAKSDSIQHELGILTRVEALQSQVEAKMARNEMLNAETEWKNAILHLQNLSGYTPEELAILPDTTTRLLSNVLFLEELESSVKEHKTTLKIAELTQQQIKDEEKVIRAERRMDLSLIAGFEYNKASVTPELDAPMDKVLLLGIGIPLKFSNFNKSELRQINLAKEQAEWEAKATEIEVISTLREAFNKYKTAEQQLNSLENELMEEAETILNGIIYAYQRGSTSFLEVLNARSSYNDIQTLYYESLYEYAASYLELQHAAGRWNLGL